MIQRIQTIFLLLIIACMGAFLYLPIWNKVDTQTGETHQLDALSYQQLSAHQSIASQEYMPYALPGVLAIIVMLTTFFQIFKYKNRVFQMKLGIINAVLILAVLASMMWFVFSGQKEWLPSIPSRFGAGLFMPAIAMIFNRMAIRAIKKDEDLVRSVDRIR